MISTLRPLCIQSLDARRDSKGRRSRTARLFAPNPRRRTTFSAPASIRAGSPGGVNRRRSRRYRCRTREISHIAALPHRVPRSQLKSPASAGFFRSVSLQHFDDERRSSARRGASRSAAVSSSTSLMASSPATSAGGSSQSVVLRSRLALDAGPNAVPSGLRFDSSRGEVEAVVIDSVEKPASD
jgi:hypothetical protein